MSGIDRYAVIGNPVAHSLSPQIHAQFARLCEQSMHYARLEAPIAGFAQAVDAFRAAGGRGLNVTVPFKLEAAAYADQLGTRARLAGAVNTLCFNDEGCIGENTDGLGLVADLRARLGIMLDGIQVLIFGAGGAARGVIGPLLDAGVAQITIINRDQARAEALVREFGHTALAAGGYPQCELRGRFDRAIVLNATSAGLSGHSLPIPAGFWPDKLLAYDMIYGPARTPFMAQALDAGCESVSDGLGMLVEQAAESFALWRGVRPATAPVYASIRALVDQRQ